MTVGQVQTPEAPPEEVRVAHRMHPGWWALVAVVLLFVVGIVNLLLTNPNLEWPVVWEYLFDPRVLRGVVLTIELTILAMFFGILLGILTAVMRLSPIKILSNTAWVYTWFFRGTPLLVQLIFWYNIAALLPEITIGVPFTSLTFWSANTNVVVTPFIAAVVGLALNEGAYMSEIVRGGILSVEHGQTEAGVSLGMKRSRVMRRIILPQAMRVIIPPTGNQVIGMLKSTSLVAVTSTAELLYSVQKIYSQNFQTIPLLIVASLWYLAITSVLSVIQYYIERRYARGSRLQLPPTPWQRVKASFVSARARMKAEDEERHR